MAAAAGHATAQDDAAAADRPRGRGRGRSAYRSVRRRAGQSAARRRAHPGGRRRLLAPTLNPARLAIESGQLGPGHRTSGAHPRAVLSTVRMAGAGVVLRDSDRGQLPAPRRAGAEATGLGCGVDGRPTSAASRRCAARGHARSCSTPTSCDTVVLLLDCRRRRRAGGRAQPALARGGRGVLPGWADTASRARGALPGRTGGDRRRARGGRASGERDESRSASGPSTGRFGIVDLDAAGSCVDGASGGMRVFAGYAGWSAAQLEAEIDEGSWFVVDAEPGDLRGTTPQDLWRGVLRRQRSELSWVSTAARRPVD